MSLDSASGITTGASQYVQANYHDLQYLPHPNQTWRYVELHEDVKKHWQMLFARNIIKRVDRGDPELDNKFATWRTDKRCYETIQKKLERVKEGEGFLPCGHDGFRSHDETLECKRCGKKHEKAEVKERG